MKASKSTPSIPKAVNKQTGAAALADQRPETSQLKQVQELINASPVVQQHHRIQAMASQYSEQVPQPVQQATNGGLPHQLKTGIENLSGYSMSDVKVHYNSTQPAQMQAHAFAQGRDIHLAPGQEQHLPHEAWHVVQQKQGRVRPTLQLHSGTQVNDDAALEQEADVMGSKAQSEGVAGLGSQLTLQQKALVSPGPVQRRIVTNASAITDFVIMASVGAYMHKTSENKVDTIGNSDYSSIGAPGEPLYIVAHGNTSEVANLSPTKMRNELVNNGLPNKMTNIYLAACESGASTGPKAQNSYAHKLANQLGATDYPNLKVTGVPGKAAITNLETAMERAVASNKQQEANKVDDELKEELQVNLQSEYSFTTKPSPKQFMNWLQEQHGGDISKTALAAFDSKSIQQFFKSFHAKKALFNDKLKPTVVPTKKKRKGYGKPSLSWLPGRKKNNKVTDGEAEEL